MPLCVERALTRENLKAQPNPPTGVVAMYGVSYHSALRAALLLFMFELIVLMYYVYEILGNFGSMNVASHTTSKYISVEVVTPSRTEKLI